MSDPILIHTADLAARLGIAVPTLIRWAAERPDIRSCKFSRNLWKLAEVERLMGVRK